MSWTDNAEFTNAIYLLGVAGSASIEEVRVCWADRVCRWWQAMRTKVLMGLDAWGGPRGFA